MNAPFRLATEPAPETGRPSSRARVGFIRHYRFAISLSEPGPLQFYLGSLLVPHSRGELVRAALLRRTGFLPLLRARECLLDQSLPLDRIVQELSDLGHLRGKPSAIVLGDYADSLRRKSVIFLFDEGAATPSILIKLSDDQDQARNIGHEHNSLAQLRQKLRASLTSTLPQPLAALDLEQGTACCQMPLPGKAMFVETRNSLNPRGLTHRHFGLASDWLVKFQQDTRVGQVALGDSGAIDALLAVQKLSQPLQPQTLDYLIGIVRQLERSADLSVPIAAAHGDFWTRNLLVDGAQLGVIDWEAFAEEASIFDDLFHFAISYGQSFPWHLGRWSDPAKALRTTLSDKGWMGAIVKAAVRRHCELMSADPRLPDLLLPVFLARQAKASGGIWLRLLDELAGMDR